MMLLAATVMLTCAQVQHVERGVLVHPLLTYTQRAEIVLELDIATDEKCDLGYNNGDV